jgi:hypothetical protein
VLTFITATRLALMSLIPSFIATICISVCFIDVNKIVTYPDSLQPYLLEYVLL